ncbi:MAG TPA: cellulase family glycosylhydrolase [Mycobacteriales bacterium]|nr:cellulase family glycosylhydrolase [Mycobacteriales bacterium]HWC34233.1 cellulase family glycosylhydrolase [Mycobacteriales bacterium]
MPASRRNAFDERAGVVASAIVVTVLVAVGALIASRGASAPASSPAPGPVKSLPLGKSLAPVQLLRGAATTFDTSTGGWTASGGTVKVGHRAHQGAGALSAIATGSAMTLWSPVENAKAGDRYVGEAYHRGTSTAVSGQLELRFIDASGAVTDTEVSEAAAGSTTDWGVLPVVAGIAPKGVAKVQLGVSFPPASAAQLVDDATLGQTPGGHARVVGPLTTRGNQILDGDGQPLILRGLQRFGLEGGTNNPLPTEAEIQQLSMWGANEVRISLGEQKWLATSCAYEPDYPEVVDRVVHWVTSRGMVALLNLHFATVGRCGKAGLTPMADSPGAITFWQQVATRYENNPLVAFDLFNEPQVSQSVWFSGGTFDDNGKTVTAAGMQQLYQTVRGTGARNLVLISGLNFASSPPTEFVEGTNIAYGEHVYTCPNAPPPQCTTPDPYNPAPMMDRWNTVAKTYPVMVSEFGWPNGDSGTYNANVIANAEQLHRGWSGFAWDGGTGGLFTLVQAHPASDGTTIEPNASGMALVAGFALNWPAKS